MLVGQLEWATRNLLNALDFIADDKLNWKPEPAAKSVLEIVNHAAGAMQGIAQMLDGGSYETHFAPAVNRHEAKLLLQKNANFYVTNLRALQPHDMTRTLFFEIGEMPICVLMQMAVLDLVHHHGQIAYIQTLLGDQTDHLVM